jgi:hypothetical protein
LITEQSREEVPPGLEGQVARIKEEGEHKMLKETPEPHVSDSPRLKPSMRHDRQEILGQIQATQASVAYVMNTDIPRRKEELKASSPVLTQEAPGSPGQRVVIEREVRRDYVREHQRTFVVPKRVRSARHKNYTPEELLSMAERAEGVMTLHEQYAKEAMNEAQKLEKKIQDHEKYADALDTIHSDLMERAKLYANRRRFKDARRILEEARDVKKRSMEQRDIVISSRKGQEDAKHQAQEYFEAATEARIEADALKVRCFAAESTENAFVEDEEEEELQKKTRRPSVPPPGLEESVAKVRLLRSIEEIERLVSSQEEEEEEEEKKKKDEEKVKKVEIEMELKKTRELLVRARKSTRGQSMSELEWLDFERKAIESTLLRFASSSSAPMSSFVAPSSVLTSTVTSSPSTVTSSHPAPKTSSNPPPPPPPPPPPTQIPTPTFDETYYSYDNFNNDDFDTNKINFKAQVEAARRKAKQQIQAARARRKARSYYAKQNTPSGRGEEEWRRRYRELNHHHHHHHSQRNEEDEVIENVVRMVNEKFASETKKSPPEKKSPPSYRDAKNSLRDQKFTKNRFFLQARSYRKGKS